MGPTFRLYSANVPSLHTSYYSFTTVLVSAPTSYFTLSVPMCEVSCVGCTLLVRDPRSL